ncbi:MAG: hypothetical protein R3F39_09420 [Myxococcota bacterium]
MIRRCGVVGALMLVAACGRGGGAAADAGQDAGQDAISSVDSSV